MIKVYPDDPSMSIQTIESIPAPDALPEPEPQTQEILPSPLPAVFNTSSVKEIKRVHVMGVSGVLEYGGEYSRDRSKNVRSTTIILEHVRLAYQDCDYRSDRRSVDVILRGDYMVTLGFDTEQEAEAFAERMTHSLLLSIGS